MLLRATVVAQALNVSRAFAYRLMQQGKIRTVFIGKTRRGRPVDLYGHLYHEIQNEAAQIMDRLVTPIQVDFPVTVSNQIPNIFNNIKPHPNILNCTNLHQKQKTCL
jgi:excisionase family DNA binding protein